MEQPSCLTLVIITGGATRTASAHFQAGAPAPGRAATASMLLAERQLHGQSSQEEHTLLGDSDLPAGSIFSRGVSIQHVRFLIEVMGFLGNMMADATGAADIGKIMHTPEQARPLIIATYLAHNQSSAAVRLHVSELPAPYGRQAVLRHQDQAG